MALASFDANVSSLAFARPPGDVAPGPKGAAKMFRTRMRRLKNRWSPLHPTTSSKQNCRRSGFDGLLPGGLPPLGLKIAAAPPTTNSACFSVIPVLGETESVTIVTGGADGVPTLLLATRPSEKVRTAWGSSISLSGYKRDGRRTHRSKTQFFWPTKKTKEEAQGRPSPPTPTAPP